ncbi:LysE family translocator [Shewanella avicenniae]|uniref:LysE family translocator n=1 Tax=Shewanella avicenniae TaxID=2814294 RepID=A0ABX7QKQ9_9GAMM|nr:LysE family translocator [Shewanella avicenniae]QSX32043.1 LysE family translocator [Shewanella avicenniae]
MSWISLLITFGLVHVAALVAPGPDFALMLRAAVSGGRKYAFALALGLSSAIMLHTLTVTFAADVLQLYLPSLMLVLPWLAASWLGYLGISCLRAPIDTSAPTAASVSQLNLKNGWWTGFATNALNPKAYVYFFSVIAGMLPHQSPLGFKLALIGLFFLLALAWFGFLGWALNINRFRQQLIRRQWLILKFSGVVLLVFAALLLLQGYQRLLA